jgi:hypothetical protein
VDKPKHTIMERKGDHGHSAFEGKSQIDSSARPAWFTEHAKSIPEDGRFLLEEYSGIPPEDVLLHVTSVVRNPLATAENDLASLMMIISAR